MSPYFIIMPENMIQMKIVERMSGAVMATVDFELAAFDDGSVHVRELIDRLAAASPRVIVLVTQVRVQRAICAQCPA